MPILHPIFDANVYRQLTPEQADVLKTHERAQSVVALAGFGPALELGAGLADQEAPDFRATWRAFAAMWRHTRLYDGSRTVVPMLHDTDSQLAWGLFRKRLPDRRQDADVFGWALGELGSSGDYEVPDHLESVLTAMRSRVEAREAKFAQDMKAMVQQLDPGASGWQPHPADPEKRKGLLSEVRMPEFLTLLARSRVAASAESCGVALSEAEKVDAAALVASSFPVALNFFRHLLLGMVESGTDFSKGKHANSAWDMELAFVASPASAVKGVPSILVTNERRFHRAAAEAGCSPLVLDYKAYRGLVDADGLWQYAEQLQ